MHSRNLGALAITILVTADSSVEAAAPKRVLVLELNAGSGIEKPRLLQLSMAVAQAVSALPNHQAITLAEERLKLKVEEVKQIESCRDQAACYAAVAGLKEIDLLVRATAGLVGGDLALDLTLLDPKGAKAQHRISWLIDDDDELADAVRPAISALFEPRRAKPVSYHLPNKTKSFAVFDLEAPGLPAQTAAHATHALMGELEKVRGARVVGRDDLRTLVDFEARRQLVGCTNDANCTTKIGATLGVDLLVSGHLVKVDDTYLISLRLISPKTAEVQNRVTDAHDGEEAALSDAVRRATRKLLGL
jgi:hypothetical protein